jgi:hypothetical protein
LTTVMEAREPQQTARTEIKALETLLRAGFEISAFRCFIEGEPSVAWEARSSFLRPHYAVSLGELHTGCKSLVAAMLVRRGYRLAAARRA